MAKKKNEQDTTTVEGLSGESKAIDLAAGYNKLKEFEGKRLLNCYAWVQIQNCAQAV